MSKDPVLAWHDTKCRQQRIATIVAGMVPHPSRATPDIQDMVRTAVEIDDEILKQTKPKAKAK